MHLVTVGSIRDSDMYIAIAISLETNKTSHNERVLYLV